MALSFLHLWHTMQQASPTIAGMLVASAWESLVLVAGAMALLTLLREASPERRMLVWTAVLVLTLLLPALTLYAPQQAVASPRAVHVVQGYSVWFALLWLLGSAVRFGLLGRQLAHLSGVRRRAVPADIGPETASLLREVRGASLHVSREVSRPCVAGLLRPRVLFPVGLLAELPADDLRQVLFHELEHLRRWDDWLNLLQQVSLALLPLHPALLWLDRRLSRERELACDDGVIRRGAGAKGYAAVLVRLAELSVAWRGTALALSLLGPRGRRSELGQRVERLLAGAARPVVRESRWSVPCAALLVACFAAALALCPQWIRFDRVSPLSSLPSAATAEIVPPRMGGGAAGPVLTRFQVNQVPQARPVAARASARRFAFRRAGLVVRDRRVTQQRVPARFETTPRRTWASDRSVPLTTPRVRLTDFEFSQPLYAAVPVAGGWLLVQL